ncbi:NmrA-like family protein [compost metagenome]
MIAILGASGHVGSSVVRALRDEGVSALAVVHSSEQARAWERENVAARALDILDTDELSALFKDSRRAFLLNPPASPNTDTDAVETATATSIAEAVRNSGLEKVVLASTYGARPGDRIGDLSVLYAFEKIVEATGVPTAINRGAYYFTNLDPLIGMARHGEISTPFPPELEMPMVSPIDLGRAAAVRLMSSIDDIGIQYVEGPERLTFARVAEELASLLGRSVDLRTIARDEIEDSFCKLGFSEAAAVSYARMTIASIDGMELPASPVRGQALLRRHLEQIAAAAD